MDLNKWVEHIRKGLDDINSFRPKDRLDFIKVIVKLNNLIMSSSRGWNIWLTNALVASQFSKDDLTIIFNEFKQITNYIVNNNLKWAIYLARRLNIKLDNSKRDASYVA